MQKRLELTTDHLRLIPFILINDDKDEVLEIDKIRMFTVQTDLVSDVALILGIKDKKHISEEMENHIREVYFYVKDNLYLIETLIHQFVIKGGIEAGVYVCDDTDMVWSRL